MDEKTFKKEIWNYYRNNKRILPWRNVNDPYKIFVSEIMLQQTQVSRVLKKYPEFIKKFPDFSSLANAKLSEVLRVWQGMGYNRRARFMREAAYIIKKQYVGILPQDASLLKELPGIGSGTAGSLVVFAYNKPVCFVETNIRRVFIHFFFNKRKNIDDKEILQLVDKTMDADCPREWYYALMDYGAMLPRREKTNVNQYSKLYAKQKPFKGSRREIRGKIISFLTSRQSYSAIEMARLMKKEVSDIQDVLNSLEREKMIKKVGNIYKIK